MHFACCLPGRVPAIWKSNNAAPVHLQLFWSGDEMESNSMFWAVGVIIVIIIIEIFLYLGL